MTEIDIKGILNSLMNLYHSNTFSMKYSLITKKINKDSSVSSENRFIFDIYKVSLDKKMVDFFKTGSLDTLNKMVGNNELEYHDYSVISDDGTDAIYGYANIEDLEFRKVLEKINKDSGINILKSLEEVKSDILAFCLKISTQDDGFTIYRKLTKSKVATDTPLNTFQKMQAIFDVNSATMKVVPMQTVSFDKK